MYRIIVYAQTSRYHHLVLSVVQVNVLKKSFQSFPNTVQPTYSMDQHSMNIEIMWWCWAPDLSNVLTLYVSPCQKLLTSTCIIIRLNCILEMNTPL